MSDKCPKCKSTNTYVTYDSKEKYRKAVIGDCAAALAGGIIGTVVAGPVGTAIGGFLGTRAGTLSGNTKRKCCCKNCGYVWYK